MQAAPLQTSAAAVETCLYPQLPANLLPGQPTLALPACDGFELRDGCCATGVGIRTGLASSRYTWI